MPEGSNFFTIIQDVVSLDGLIQQLHHVIGVFNAIQVGGNETVLWKIEIPQFFKLAAFIKFHG